MSEELLQQMRAVQRRDYPIDSQRAFYRAIQLGSQGNQDIFCAKDAASLSSFPAPDKFHADQMAKSLNRIIQWHVDQALYHVSEALTRDTSIKASRQ